MTRWYRGALAALVLAGAPAGPAEAAPSFDCRKARLPVEKAICASRRLSDLDRLIARAYPVALARLGEDAAAVAALKASQRLFLLTRNTQFDGPGDYSLEGHMASQLDLLRSIGPDPRSGLVGEWKTSEGTLFVGQPGKTGLSPVNARSVTQDSKRWTCEFLGEARIAGDTAIVEGRDRYRAEYAGWRLKLVKTGRLVSIEALRPESKPGTDTYNPFCGMNGSLAGSYFPADELPDNPCAGIPPGQCRE